eukprot:scaffold127605_cov48-Phaeocystis_antarctica.AAC.1
MPASSPWAPPLGGRRRRSARPPERRPARTPLGARRRTACPGAAAARRTTAYRGAAPWRSPRMGWRSPRASRPACR